jgi:molybdopterin-guanine dinucleotide biosynthesis protein A
VTAAILLAGGRASRVGGAAKPHFDIDGSTLLERAVLAVDGCTPVIVVGDVVDGITGVLWMREDPPFGGPAAAVVWALDAWRDEPGDGDEPEWTYLLSCDLPDAIDAVRRLENHRATAPLSTDGLCLADHSNHPQWLIGVYRTSALRRARARIAMGGRDSSMRALLADLSITVISAPDSETADVDTWDDLAQARRRHERQQS